MLDISDLAHKLLGNIRNTSLESCCPLTAARWTFSATQTSMPQYTGLDGDRYHVACFLPNLAAYVSWRVLRSAKWDKCHHNHPIFMAVLPVNMFLLAVINFFFHVFLNKTLTNKQHRYVTTDWASHYPTNSVKVLKEATSTDPKKKKNIHWSLSYCHYSQQNSWGKGHWSIYASSLKAIYRVLKCLHNKLKVQPDNCMYLWCFFKFQIVVYVVTNTSRVHPK